MVFTTVGDIPALSMQQFNHFAEVTFDKSYANGSLLKTGYQFNFIDNTNDNAVTGRLPLIPDYRLSKNSVFAIFFCPPEVRFYRLDLV